MTSHGIHSSQKAWALLAGLLLLAAPALRAETKEEFEERVQTHLSRVLDSYLGVGKAQVTVFVDADPLYMVPPVKEAPGPNGMPRDASGEKPTYLWSDYSKNSKKSILPGFSARQEMVIRDDKKQPAPPKVEDKKWEKLGLEPMVLWKIKNIRVTLMLDRNAAAKEKEVAAMVTDIVGLDPSRGDALNIYRLPFQSPWKLLFTNPESWIGIFKGLLYILLLILTIYALYALSQFLLGFVAKMRETGLLPAKKEPEEKKEEPKEEKEEKPEPLPEKPLVELPPLPVALPVAAAEAPAEDLFGPHKALKTVTAGNAKLLGELLATDPITQVAAVVSFIAPHLASLVIDELPERQKQDVLITLAKAKSVSPDTLKALSESIEQRLTHAVGGTDMVANMLSQKDMMTQDRLLALIEETNPELATKIRRAIFGFDDLLSLPERDLRLLVQAVSIQEWATALSAGGPSQQSAFARVLPQDTALVFQQYIDMGAVIGKPTEAQWRILKRAKEMQAEGRLTLVKRSGAHAGNGNGHGRSEKIEGRW